jgi:hypothetical protein
MAGGVYRRRPWWPTYVQRRPRVFVAVLAARTTEEIAAPQFAAIGGAGERVPSDAVESAPDAPDGNRRD